MLRRALLASSLIAALTVLGSGMQWDNSVGTLHVPIARAASSDLTITSCDVDDVANASCLSAISADGSTTFALGKNSHIDAAFATLETSSITSATLYYDSWGSLSGTWAIYVKSARDGSTLCSVDPAPENGSQTTNNTSCTISVAQLSSGVWLQVNNNDDKGPENINLDYIRLTVEYTAAVSISVTTSGTVGFGVQAANTAANTTSGDLNDIETVQVDSGPADLDVRTSTWSDGSNTWTVGTSNGADQVQWEFSNDGSSWTTFEAADTLYTLDTNIATSGTSDLYLRLTTPTSTTSFDEHTATVTIVASTP